MALWIWGGAESFPSHHRYFSQVNYLIVSQKLTESTREQMIISFSLFLIKFFFHVIEYNALTLWHHRCANIFSCTANFIEYTSFAVRLISREIFIGFCKQNGFFSLSFIVLLQIVVWKHFWHDFTWLAVHTLLLTYIFIGVINAVRARVFRTMMDFPITALWQH